MRRKPGTKPTKAVNIRRRDREEQALALRRTGMSYQRIADQLGVSKQAAHGMLKALFAESARELAEDANEVRQLEVERLDVLLEGIWHRATVEAEEKAIETCLRIMARRSALLGLDAPKRQELTGAGGAPIEIADARKEIHDVVARLSAAIEAEGNSGEPER